MINACFLSMYDVMSNYKVHLLDTETDWSNGGMYYAENKWRHVLSGQKLV